MSETRLADWKKLKKIKLTENQRKVIESKYLRDDPSIEYWLRSVARNVALSELFYSKAIKPAEILNGITHTIEKQEAGSDMVLIHTPKRKWDEKETNHKKLIDNLYSIASSHAEGKRLVGQWEEKFYNIMADFRFLPNSPTLMNAGRDLQQLSACYVLPIDDSLEGWMETARNTAIIHKSGGGTGFSGCRVRPKGDYVKSTKGVASGAMSPFMMINAITEEVKQGGTRRGANMGILPYSHPDVEEFINSKKDSGKLENFNISVAVDKKFMEAVMNNEQVDMINPRTGEKTKTINALDLFNRIVNNAWSSGDPGIVVLDRINNSFSNPTPKLGNIESTNPCGEQPLLPYEPCNLGSINLYKFCSKGSIDWTGLEETVRLAVRFLDDVIDVNNYPVAEIERMAKGTRRIGLGVMGWAEMLAVLGIPYDSEEAVKKGEEVMAFINRKALEASEDLAKERGVFPFFKDSIYDKTGKHYRSWAKGKPRNAARTTIAPTGTIAIAAGLQGSGIEPFFAIAYTRYTAKALDAIAKGRQPDPKDVFFEVNNVFRDVAKENNYFGVAGDELWKLIDANHKSIRGMKEIPEKIQRNFPTAHDVPVEYHVKHQAAFQRHVDNAVSKTINLPNSATVDDVKKTYLMAYELGCKGITVYRDGSKTSQVLNIAKAETKKERDLSKGTSSQYFEIQTGYGPLHIHIDYDHDGPYRVFTNIPPLGTEISGLTSIVGILISKYLEAGGDPARIIKHLNAVKGDRPQGFGPNRVESIPNAIARAFRLHLIKTGKIKEAINGITNGNHDQRKVHEFSQPSQSIQSMQSQGREERDDPGDHKMAYCPQCYSSNVTYMSGCSGPTCFDCGFSECS